MLYKIGDFSKLTNTSVRTLRYYDELDLLKPAEIDLFTGYRYYREEQREDFNLIKLLQEIGFSLEEIKEHWDNFDDEMMLNKKNQLISERKDIEGKIRKIDYLRSKIYRGKIYKDELPQKPKSLHL